MNYIDNPLALYGMCPAYGSVDEHNRLIYKTKNKNKVICFNETFSENELDEINYEYLLEKPKVKGYYKSQLIIQGPFIEDWFKLIGKVNKDVRDTRNKFDKIVEINEDFVLEDVLELIDTWRDKSGRKYRFTRHDGYDRKFFKDFYDELKDRVTCLFFRDKATSKLVGYAVFSKNPLNNEFTYLIRKMDKDYGRNICVYIDFCVARYLFNKGYKNFTINYGASSGGCEKYKTSSRFPLSERKTVYFYKKEKENGK